MDAAERLKQFRELVAGNDPTDRQYVAPVYGDRPMLRGTVSPAIQAQFEATPSGLLVPRGTIRRPQPIDQMRMYLTAEETLDRSVPFDLILRLLSRLSLEEVLVWVAYWMAALRRPGARQEAVDVRFATTYLEPAYRQRVLNLVRTGRVLVVPQALLVLAKIAMVMCESRGAPQEEHNDRLVLALLGLTEHLGADDPEVDPEDGYVMGATPGPLGREVIANQLANRNRDEASRWAAFNECWKHLPEVLASHPRVRDMVAEYEDATGVPLDDLVTVCAAMWATAVSGTPHLAPDYFSTLPWAKERLDAALRLVAADPAQLAQMHRDEGEDLGVAWSVRTIQQFPVVRWGTGHMTVLDPDLLVDRAAGPWPLYDILRELENRGDDTTANQIRGSYAHIFEHFVIDLVAGIVGEGSTRRVYREDEIRAAYGRKHQVADLAVDYGDSWVVLDATTSGVQLKTFAGASDESVMQDIDTIARKAAQIERTIRFLRESQQTLTGYPHAGARRFHPVVVVAGASPAGPIFMALLRETLVARGVLQGPDIAPLEVFEVEDLQVAAAVAETGGPSLIDLLRGKETSGLRDMSLKDYILLDLGLHPGRPRQVQERWRAWFDTAIQELTGAA